MYCIHCGEKVEKGQNFCHVCGCTLQQSANETASTVQPKTESIHDQMKGTFMQATEKVNQMVGEQGSLEVNLKEVFSAVFKKHTKDEAETLFITGTKATTPPESEISTTWPRPWLFARIFSVFALTFLFLYICTMFFYNYLAIPGMIIIGSFAVPFSLMIFFWEMNAPRNISIYEVAKMFFIGGTSSLVTTLILYTFLPVYELDFTGAIIVGIVEEVGKLVIIIYFVKKLHPKFILNGLLIGAAIGAGFAAFESAGYAYMFADIYEYDYMISIIFMRAWMAIGTHTVWSAITGAALVAVKNSDPLKSDHVFSSRFLKLFAVPVILHAVWDMPLYSLHAFYFLFIVLIILAWVFIFSLIHAGLKQIVRIHEQTRDLSSNL